MIQCDFLLKPMAFHEYQDDKAKKIEETLWICITCGQSFQRKGFLNRHLERHAREKLKLDRKLVVDNEEFYANLCFMGFEEDLSSKQQQYKKVNGLERIIRREKRRALQEASSRKQAAVFSGFGPTIDESDLEHKCITTYDQLRILERYIDGVGATTVSPKTRYYECYLCRQQFTDYESLSIHMRVHTGFMPFECPCRMKFMFLEPFLKHLKTH